MSSVSLTWACCTHCRNRIACRRLVVDIFAAFVHDENDSCTIRKKVKKRCRKACVVVGCHPVLDDTLPKRLSGKQRNSSSSGTASMDSMTAEKSSVGIAWCRAVPLLADAVPWVALSRIRAHREAKVFDSTCSAHLVPSVSQLLEPSFFTSSVHWLRVKEWTPAVSSREAGRPLSRVIRCLYFGWSDTGTPRAAGTQRSTLMDRSFCGVDIDCLHSVFFVILGWFDWNVNSIPCACRRTGLRIVVCFGGGGVRLGQRSSA